MSFRRRLLCFFLISFTASFAYAQQGPPPKDTPENGLESVGDPYFIFDRFDPATTLKSRNESLDGLVDMMRQAPDLFIYIVSSGGRVSYPGEAIERANTIKEYLVGVGRVKAKRIELVNGGYCNEWEIYLWWGVKVPPHQRPPGRCDIDPKEVRIFSKRRYLRQKVRTFNPASNNSLNRSGVSSPVIRKIEGLIRHSPPG